MATISIKQSEICARFSAGFELPAAGSRVGALNAGLPLCTIRAPQTRASDAQRQRHSPLI